MLKELLKLLNKGSLMEQAFRETIEMITVLETMFKDSVAYLHDGTVPPNDRDVYQMDKRINLLEQKMRRHIYNHLVLSEGKELYMSLILVQMAVDLERVGDYVKNLYDIRRLAGDVTFPEKQAEMKDLEQKTLAMFPRIRKALEVSDTFDATAIQKEHFELVKQCDRRVEEFLKMEGDSNTRRTTVLVLYYRYIKRVIAHLINVASAISNPYDRVGFHPDDII